MRSSTTTRRTGPARFRAALGAAAVALAGAAGCASPADPVPAAPIAVAQPVPPAPASAPAFASAPAPSGAEAEVAPAPAADRPGPVVPEAGPGDPARVRVGSLEVDAPVVPVGVDDAGLMEVPEDVRTIGWYRFGAAPGEGGSAVLSGHVDDRVQGRGAFYELARTGTGDTVEVDTGDGTTLTYRVDSVRNFGKADLPLEEVFQRSGPPRLVLITCGGEFDRATGHYVDNIVVTAVPV
jgi:hypothetical protein